MLRKNLKKCHGSVAVAKAVGASGFSLVDAKKKLRATYAVSVNGKLRAPGFIGTLKGVTGRGSIEKIANLRRVLSSCKKMGVKLVKQDGKFKAYRTLVGQCKVKFRSTPAPIALSNVLAKYRARKAASKQQMPEYKPSAQRAVGTRYCRPSHFVRNHLLQNASSVHAELKSSWQCACVGCAECEVPPYG
jgi:hypothetical protein